MILQIELFLNFPFFSIHLFLKQFRDFIAFLKMGNSLSDCIKSMKRLCCNRFSCERPQRIIPPYYVYSFYPYSMTFCISSKFFTRLGIRSTSNPFSPNLFHCRLPKADPFADGRCCKISQTRIARSTILRLSTKRDLNL